MPKRALILAALVVILAACTTAGPQPGGQPAAITVPPNVTPLVTQVGPGSQTAANHLEAIRQAGVMRVGASTDYPPFEYLDQSGSRAGFDIELMEEIAGRMGVRVEWVDLPFEELIPAVQSKQIDLAISAFKSTPERDTRIDFTQPYYTAEDAFIAAEGFTGQIGKPEDAAGFIVGVQAGTVQEGWLKDTLVASGAMPAASVISYELVDEAIADLKAGNIQLFMADNVPAQDQVQRNTGLAIAYHGVITGGPLHIVVQDGDRELAEALNAVIQQLQTEGFIQKLAFRFITGAN